MRQPLEKEKCVLWQQEPRLQQLKRTGTHSLTHTRSHTLAHQICIVITFLTGAVIWGCPDRRDGGSSWRGVGPLSVSLYCRGRAHKVILGVTVLQDKHTNTERELVTAGAQTQNPILSLCLTVFLLATIYCFTKLCANGGVSKALTTWGEYRWLLWAS